MANEKGNEGRELVAAFNHACVEDARNATGVETVGIRNSAPMSPTMRKFRDKIDPLLDRIAREIALATLGRSFAGHYYAARVASIREQLEIVSLASVDATLTILSPTAPVYKSATIAAAFPDGVAEGD